MAQTVRNNFSNAFLFIYFFEIQSDSVVLGEILVEVSQSSFLKCCVFRESSSSRRGPNPDQNPRAMTLGTNREFILLWNKCKWYSVTPKKNCHCISNKWNVTFFKKITPFLLSLCSIHTMLQYIYYSTFWKVLSTCNFLTKILIETVVEQKLDLYYF